MIKSKGVAGVLKAWQRTSVNVRQSPDNSCRGKMGGEFDKNANQE